MSAADTTLDVELYQCESCGELYIDPDDGHCRSCDSRLVLPSLAVREAKSTTSTPGPLDAAPESLGVLAIVAAIFSGMATTKTEMITTVGESAVQFNSIDGAAVFAFACLGFALVAQSASIIIARRAES